MSELRIGRTHKRLSRFIVIMLWLVAFCMPLNPFVGDACLAVGLIAGLVDSILYRFLYKGFGRLQWLVVAFMVWSCVSALLSPRPMDTFASWFYTVGLYGSVYFLMWRYMRDSDNQRWFIRLVIASAGLVCLVGFYQYFHMHGLGHMTVWVDEAQFPGLKRRMFSTLQNPNLLGAYLLMILSFLGVMVLEKWRIHENKKALLGLLVAALFLVCMVLTYSRGIWLSFFAVVAFWGFFVDKRVLPVLLVVPVLLFFYHGEVAARLWSLFDTQDTSVLLRWALWDSTTYMIADHPVFGIGWDAFWFVYPKYNYFIQTPGVIIFHAHNMYLNMLAEVGIPGAFFYFAAIVGHGIASWQSRIAKTSFLVKYGISAVLLGILISGITDYDLFSHQVSIVFWQLLGWSAALMASAESVYQKDNLKGNQ